MRLGYINVYQAASALGSLLLHLVVLNPDSGVIHPPFEHVVAKPALLHVYVVSKSNASDAACLKATHCRENGAPRSEAKPAVSAGLHVLAVATPPPPSPQSFIGLKDSHYYQREELTQPPVALTNPVIHLPTGDDVRIIGSTLLRLFLSEQGEVDNITIAQNSLPQSYVDAIVLGHKGIRYKPGEVNGKAVKSQIEVEISLSTDLNKLLLPRADD